MFIYSCYNKEVNVKLATRKILTMNIETTLRDLNRKARENGLPFKMPYLKETWSDRHSTVREMWSNPNFSHREAFQSWACWWYLSVSHSEYFSHQDLYDEMKKFSSSEKAAHNLRFKKLWWAIDRFFALYYIEFPFSTSNRPEFKIDSVEDFFKSLSESD